MKNWKELPKAQRVERWQHVVETLKRLTPHQREKHWDMSDWGRKTDCGTVACAAGHCGLDPWFRRRGFKLDFVKCDCGDVGCETVKLTDVEEFFGVEGTDAIFYGSGSVDDVIARVEQYVEELKA
jgi:hypothetical protein